MVKRRCRWLPDIHVVAVGAIIRRLEMRLCFTLDRFQCRGMRAIMAREASACHKTMIHRNGIPASCRVAILAGIFRRNVRLAFAQCIGVVVTRYARRACDCWISVVEHRDWFPRRRCVAAVASV